TVRSPEKAERLRTAGIDAVTFDSSGELEVPDGAHWLISIPPGDLGCPAFLAAADAAKGAASVTYLSTTGVYGDLGGGWAFEWTKPAPISARAKRRVLAELQWQSAASIFRTVRLPGIYGPGRSALDRLKAGTARRIIKPGQVFSRVHVDDIVSGLVAAFQRPSATGVFHLCDDEPAPPQDVIAYGAGLVGADLPPDEAFETADLSEMAKTFYGECKRVSNARAKSALDWFPTYPTYREGLKAVLDADQT
ncbi:MAG: SDR family NAD(P)-dependent oxidoreductase, partial [Pseudomonadota bacterium]